MDVLRCIKWLASLIGVGKTDWTDESFKANFRLVRSLEKRLSIAEQRLDNCEERHRERDQKELQRDREVMELKRKVDACGKEHHANKERIEELETKIA